MGLSILGVFCAAVVATQVASQIVTRIDNHMATQPDDDPPIPEIWKAVAGAFDSDVLITMPDIDPSTAFLVDERYDIEVPKGSLTFLDHGKYSKLIYYTKTDQSFFVQDTKCTVGTLMDQPGYSLHFWDYTSGNSKDDPLGNFVFGPSALLKMTEDYQKDIKYQGKGVVRNITADYWYLATQDGYQIEYYFADELWEMPYGSTMEGVDLRAPILVTVTGKEGNPFDSSVKEFNQTVYYEYVDFKPYIAPMDWRTFTVRPGLDCKNRKTLDPKQTTPPEPVTDIKVFVETIIRNESHPDGVMFRAWLHFETYRQLMRLDIDADFVEEEAPRSSVQDLATGIEYSINKFTGKCNIKTWSPSDLGTLMGAEFAGIIMADPQHLFKLDNKYIFSGYEQTRGILTSRWTATRNDIKSSTNPGKKHKKVVVDYQFLSTYMEDIGEYTSSPLPVRVDLTIYKDSALDEIEQKQTMNLLHFQTAFESYELNPFDVSDCFDTPFKRNWYKIMFGGDWFKGASQNQDQFKREIIDKICDNTDVSYVRVPTVELDHDEEFTYAHVLVLEPADYLLQFEAPELAKPWKYDSQLNYSINDDGVCAAFCLSHEQVGFECRSFYECPDVKHSCFISNSKTPKTPAADVPKDCQHYTLTADSPDFQVPNFGVYLYILNASVHNEFNFKYTYKDEWGLEKEGTFEGESVIEEAYPGDPVFMELLKDEFHVAYTHAMLDETHTHTIISSSYTDCLIACDAAKSIDCQTFSYCYNDESCYLSDYVVTKPVDPHEITLQSDCIIMSRLYTSDYSYIRGAFYVSDPEQTISGVSDAEKCAYLCDESTDFVCRSFDICYGPKMCYLYHERSIDIPDEKINHTMPDCDHFERNDLADFKKHDHQVLDQSRKGYVDGVSVSDCAQLCEKDDEYACLGFDFCSSGDLAKTCFLTKDYYGDRGVVKHNDPNCDHYSREYYDGKSREEFAHSKKSKYKYGPGDMAGLGASMLVITIGLTFSGVYAYNSRK